VRRNKKFQEEIVVSCAYNTQCKYIICFLYCTEIYYTATLLVKSQVFLKNIMIVLILIYN